MPKYTRGTNPHKAKGHRSGGKKKRTKEKKYKNTYPQVKPSVN
jgi:hypothetical protein